MLFRESLQRQRRRVGGRRICLYLGKHVPGVPLLLAAQMSLNPSNAVSLFASVSPRVFLYNVEWPGWFLLHTVKGK